MLKKAIAIAGAGAILLSMASPAFGWIFGGDDGGTLTINNHAWVTTKVKTKANTGRNSTMFCGSIGTGAAGATSMVTNVVNTNLVGFQEPAILS